MNKLLASGVFILWFCYCIVIGWWPIYTFDMMNHAKTWEIIVYATIIASLSSITSAHQATNFYATRCIL